MRNKSKIWIIIGMVFVLFLSVVFQLTTKHLVDFTTVYATGWWEDNEASTSGIPTQWHPMTETIPGKTAWIRMEVNRENTAFTGLLLSSSDIAYTLYDSHGQPVHSNHIQGRISNSFQFIIFEQPPSVIYIRAQSLFDLKQTLKEGRLYGRLGDSDTMLVRSLQRDLDTLILVFTFILLGLSLVIYEIINRLAHKELFYLGIFSFISGINVLNYVMMMQVVIDSWLYWRYSYMAYLFMPLVLLVFVKNVVHKDNKKRLKTYPLYNILIVINCLFIGTVLIIDALHILPIAITGNYNSLIFVIVLVLIIYDIVRSDKATGFKGDFLFTTGGIIASITGLWDIFTSSVLKSTQVLLSEYGMMIYVVCILLTFLNEYLQAQKKLSSYNADLEKTVVKKTSDLRQLLDHSGEGFLTIDMFGKVGYEHSSECMRIFGEVIADTHFQELLSRHSDSDEVGMISDVLHQIEAEKNSDRQKVFLDFLPQQLWINQLYMHLQYKLIDEDHQKRILVIMRDESSKKQLESQLSEEKSHMEMALNIALYYNDFYDLYHSYWDFCKNGVPELLQMDDPQQMMNQLFMEIHSFKGDFAQFGLEATSQGLHQLESYLETVKALPLQQWRKQLAFEPLIQLVESDMDTLTGYFGQGFLDQEKNLRIPYLQIVDLESKAVQKLTEPKEYEIIESIRSLKYRNFKEIFKFYPKYLNQLANRYDKMIDPLEIVGEDIWVDVEKYHYLSKILLHLLRNTVAHGIETVDERLEAGKNMEGQVTFEINKSDQFVAIVIQDDGKGIPIDRLKEKAIAMGMDQAYIQSLSDQEALQLIFLEGLSTADTLTLTAGRGVGLSAVKRVITQLSGNIFVSSEAGSGTRFQVEIPLE